MAQHRAALEQISINLLRPAGSIGTLFKAANDLFELLNAVGKLDWRKTGHSSDVHLPEGKAVGPVWAGICIKDAPRTHKFLCALSTAITDRRAAFPDQVVHVVYAGTGPFAALALPLTTVFKPGEVQFTLLEINQESLEILKTVLAVFEAGPFVRAIVSEDATTFKADPKHPVHIVVSETMQTGLLHEPQVAISTNLAPQLAPGGVLIPQRVSVHAGLLHPLKDTARMTSLDKVITDHYQLLGSVFELTQTTALPAGGDFPAIRLNIPLDIDPGYSKLALFTTIQLYDGIELRNGESVLTQPVILSRWTGENQGGQVCFKYHLGSDPGFEWQIIL